MSDLKPIEVGCLAIIINADGDAKHLIGRQVQVIRKVPFSELKNRNPMSGKIYWEIDIKEEGRAWFFVESYLMRIDDLDEDGKLEEIANDLTNEGYVYIAVEGKHVASVSLSPEEFPNSRPLNHINCRCNVLIHKGNS